MLQDVTNHEESGNDTDLMQSGRFVVCTDKQGR